LVTGKCAYLVQITRFSIGGEKFDYSKYIAGVPPPAGRTAGQLWEEGGRCGRNLIKKVDFASLGRYSGDHPDKA